MRVQVLEHVGGEDCIHRTLLEGDVDAVDPMDRTAGLVILTRYSIMPSDTSTASTAENVSARGQ